MPGIFQIKMSFVVALATHHYNEDRKQRELLPIRQPFLCYYDDVLLISESVDEHNRAVYFSLYEFARHHLTVNISKCQLGTDCATILGHWLSDKSMHRAHKYDNTVK